ncbi:MAG TPA: photosystem II biogenesis protein Psp29 [Allocoleopsis sp.]
MNNTLSSVPTVSDTKRKFYDQYTRPINSIYRRVVEELMVEMHLLSVNADFHYDPIYALGVVTSFDKFMQGYQPEKDKSAIFDAIISAVGGNTQTYQQDAQELLKSVENLSISDLSDWINSHDKLTAIARNSKFKYSRVFAIGLCTLLETIAPDVFKDQKKAADVLISLANSLNIPHDKLQKDLDLYRSNLEKMTQAKIMMEDLINAERKKRNS